MPDPNPVDPVPPPHDGAGRATPGPTLAVTLVATSDGRSWLDPPPSDRRAGETED